MSKVVSPKDHIVLDLDQTLISSEDINDYDKNFQKSVQFKSHDMDDCYIVFERPHLQEFLDFLFSNFKVSVWTAASKDYAMFIIKEVIQNGRDDRKLEWVFFSYHCDISKKLTGKSKNLEILETEFKLPDYSFEKTLILDDYDEVYKTQPSNCILVEAFEYTSEKSSKDNNLKKIQKQLKQLKSKK